MTANVLASSADFLGLVDAVCRLLLRRLSLRSVDAVGSRRHTNIKKAKERKTADAHEETMTMRCVVQNVSSSEPGVRGSGGGGDGSGGGGGGGVDGSGMEGGGVVGEGGGRGGGGFGDGDAGGRGDCVITPTTSNDRTRDLMLISNGSKKKSGKILPS